MRCVPVEIMTSNFLTFYLILQLQDGRGLIFFMVYKESSQNIDCFQYEEILMIAVGLLRQLKKVSKLILFMSEQPEGHLQIPSSYNFHRERVGHTRAGSIDAQKFHLWTRNDMYRSSYAQFHSPDSTQPRSAQLPGYAGFIPTNRAESLHAATYTNITKKAINDPTVNINSTQLSSTGRNLNPQALIDHSKDASSHKYGKTQIQTPHPAWVPQKWSTTNKSTYLSPEKYPQPTYRETEKHLQTHKMKTKQSGFQRDRAYWDGNGWKPNPILNPLNLSSEYRDRYNPEMDYHRKVEKDSLPQLKRQQYKYRLNK